MSTSNLLNPLGVRMYPTGMEPGRVQPGHGEVSLLFFFHKSILETSHSMQQLSATDVSAQVTMKDAAKCDKRCEWQNSANQENAERILHFSVTPKSMSG